MSCGDAFRSVSSISSSSSSSSDDVDEPDDPGRGLAALDAYLSLSGADLVLPCPDGRCRKGCPSELALCVLIDGS